MQRARDSGSLWRWPQSLVQVIRPFASRAVVLGLGDVFCCSPAPATEVATIKISEVSAKFLITLDALIAAYVQKVLNSEKPGNLPIEQPTKFELVVNLKTARTIGVNINREFLLRADDFID